MATLLKTNSYEMLHDWLNDKCNRVGPFDILIIVDNIERVKEEILSYINFDFMMNIGPGKYKELVSWTDTGNIVDIVMKNKLNERVTHIRVQRQEDAFIANVDQYLVIVNTQL